MMSAQGESLRLVANFILMHSKCWRCEKVVYASHVIYLCNLHKWLFVECSILYLNCYILCYECFIIHRQCITMIYIRIKVFWIFESLNLRDSRQSNLHSWYMTHTELTFQGPEDFNYMHHEKACMPFWHCITTSCS